MARTVKKKKELTIEENLAEALVPVEEQPYQVPENWCWTKLSSCIISSKEKTADFSDSKIKYIGLEHMEKDSGIIGYGSAEGVKSLKNVFHKGQLLYGKLRPYLNKHDIAPFDGICSTDILVFDKTECSLTSFINYYFNQSRFLEYVVGNSKGINLPRVSESVIMEAMVPLPPLPEQQRIVDRIESLFAKLDEAKEKAQAVVDGFEDRKAAILHKAFTGELTKEWKKTNGLPDWKLEKLGSNLKPMETRKPTGEYFFYIDIDSIDNKHQIVKAPKKVLLKDAPSRASRAVHCGDVLFSMVRPYLKNIALVDESLQNCIASTGFYVCSPKSTIDSNYLYHLLCSKDAIDYLMQFMKGDNSPSIRKDNLLDMEIMLPSLPEQKQIETILNSILEKEQQAKEASEQVISQIDTMKKSILARAFRGELGTNDSADESAVELLKRVL